MPPAAHILTAGGGLGLVGWIPAGVGVAAICVVAFGPRRLRRPGVVVTAVAMGSLLVVAIVSPAPPVAPGYTIGVIEPAGAVTSPFSVVVCGRSTSGTSVPVPGSSRVLSVVLDGREVVSLTSGQALVQAGRGAHRLHVEVLTKDHVEYQPPLAADVDIEVTGTAPMTTPRSCP